MGGGTLFDGLRIIYLGLVGCVLVVVQGMIFIVHCFIFLFFYFEFNCLQFFVCVIVTIVAGARARGRASDEQKWDRGGGP